MPQWLALGPAPQVARNGTSVSGRVNAIDVSMNYNGLGHSAMFLGTTDGGVWRSTDVASLMPVWRPLTDDVHVPIGDKVNGILRVGALTVDPAHARRIYASVGDPGIGVLRSDDGGDSWRLLGRATFFGGWPIARILVDPTDASGDTLYVAGGPDGVHASTDGGLTWQPRTGGLPAIRRISDLEYTLGPSQSLTLHAGVVLAGGDNGVWTSTDGGGSWARAAQALLDRQLSVIVGGAAIIRITLAADHRPGTPSGIFAAVSAMPIGELLNILALDGAVWRAVATTMPASVYTQSGANQPIGLAPDGTIYLGTATTGVLQSVDAGRSWIQIRNGTNGVTPHVDHRAFGFFSGAVYNGNDGGIWRFTPLSQGASGPGTWESLNTPGLQTHLVNGASLSQFDASLVLVGSQDNSTAVRSGGAWKSLKGGPADGGRVRLDPDATVAHPAGYAEGPPDPNPDFFFRVDDAATDEWQSKGFLTDNDVPWSKYFAINPANSSNLIMGLGQGFESVDRGDSWTPVSPAFISKKTSATALAFSADGSTLYVAYGRQVFRSVRAGGANPWPVWSPIDQGTNWKGDIVTMAVDPTLLPIGIRSDRQERRRGHAIRARPAAADLLRQRDGVRERRDGPLTSDGLPECQFATGRTAYGLP